MCAAAAAGALRRVMLTGREKDPKLFIDVSVDAREQYAAHHCQPGSPGSALDAPARGSAPPHSLDPGGSLTPHLSCPPRTVSGRRAADEISRRRLIPLLAPTVRDLMAAFDATWHRRAPRPTAGFHQLGQYRWLSTGSAKGHEDAFPRSRLSAGCRFSQGTFAGTRGNGRDAP